MEQNKIGDLEMWWIPLERTAPFKTPVKTPEEGGKILEVLSKYNRMLYDNDIKTGFANVGVLKRFCADDGSGTPGWEDWYDDATGSDDLKAYLSDKEGHIS